MSRRKIFISWAAVSLVLLGCDSLFENQKAFPSRFPETVLHFLKSGDMPKVYLPKSLETYDPASATIFGDRATIPVIALWGDSHAGALLPVLDALGKEHKIAFRSYDMPSQPPMTGVTRRKLPDAKKRADYSAGALAAITGDSQIRTVILHARWASYTRDENLEKGPPALLDHSFDTIEAQRNYVISRLDDAVNQLLKAGKQVVIVHPMPEIAGAIPDYLAKLAAAGKEVPYEIRSDQYHSYNRKIVQALDAWTGTSNVKTIHPEQLLIRNARMRIRSGNELLYRDNDHLSVAGALYLKALFEPFFREPLR